MPQKLFGKFPVDVNTLCCWERASLLCPFTLSNSVEINRKNSLLNIQLLLCVNTANPRSRLFFKRKLHIWMHWRKSLPDCGLSVRIAREAYMLMFCVQGESCGLWIPLPITESREFKIAWWQRQQKCHLKKWLCVLLKTSAWLSQLAHFFNEGKLSWSWIPKKNISVQTE